ncbi:ABC transporter substrate-binding protein [Synergistales bacterium]|nr:ABC transporter substrate-binding protein [Synergistales bacterium]
MLCRTKSFSVGFAVIALCALIFTVFNTGAAAAADAKTLKLALIAPLTGAAARSGEEIRNGADLAFSEIGYKVGDYKIEFVYVDSESDAEKAARAYERAITQDGVVTGLLNWHSWVSVSCMELSAKYKVPHFFGFGAGQEINDKYRRDPEKYKYWVGKGWPLPSKLITGYVETIRDAINSGKWTPRNKNFAVYGVDQDWGRMFGASIKEAFEAAGWTCVAEDWVPVGETEFYPLLNKIKSRNVSLIVGTISDPPSAAAIIKQSKEINLPAMMILDGLGWVGEWYDLAGDSANYVIDQIPGFSTATSKKFVEDFKAKYNIDPGPSTAGMSYDLAKFFIEVLKTTLADYGEITSETVMKTAEEKVITGKLTYKDGVVHKEYKYTPDNFPDLEVGENYYIFPCVQYMDGNMVSVWPSSQKNGELEIPDYVK